MTKLQEVTFFALLRKVGIPAPVAEHQFHSKRKWRFDFAWPDKKIALEVEGGVWTGGRHTSSKGFLGDMEKYNAAAVDGWRVLRTTPEHLYNLGTMSMLKNVLTI
jgi:hypothetical protein